MRKPKHHIVAMAKGGCGKTTTAVLLASYYKKHNIKTLNFDTDPMNTSFALFKSLSPTWLDLKDDELFGLNIYDKKIDKWYEELSKTNCDTITDIGASSFASLVAYLVSMSVVDTFTEVFEHEFIFHVPFVGSEGLQHSVSGLNSLIGFFQNKASYVCWLQSFQGEVKDIEGKNFYELNAFKDNTDFITSVIEMPKQNRTETEAMHQMLMQNKTFADMKANESLQLAERMRYELLEKRFFKLIEDGGFLNDIFEPIENNLQLDFLNTSNEKKEEKKEEFEKIKKAIEKDND